MLLQILNHAKDPLHIGHAAKCLGPPPKTITLWSRGEMPGTSLSPYYPLVTRQNAWDLLLTLLPIGHAGKCLGPPHAKLQKSKQNHNFAKFTLDPDEF